MDNSYSENSKSFLDKIENILFNLNEAPTEDEIRTVFDCIDSLKEIYENEEYELSYINYFFAEFGSWCADLRDNVRKINDPKDLQQYSRVLMEFRQTKHALIGQNG